MSNSTEVKVDNEQLPRKGSVMFNFHYQNELSKQKTLMKWRKVNKYLIIPLYRARLLPILGLGKTFLILETKGWKTGKIRRTPLEFRRYKGNIIVFAARGENATWVKNMRANPLDISVLRGFHHFKPELEYVSGIAQKMVILKWYVSKYNKAAKMLFGWDPQNDNPETTDFSNLASLITVIILRTTNS